VVVSDTGLGIDAAFLPFIFERFRQAESGFARSHGGLGLGLALVRELVETHGGSVQAESDGPGTGATFRVRLPLTIVHQERQPVEPRVHPTAPAYASESPASHRLDGLRILAVDDEQDSLSLLKSILQSAGAEVTTASSAARALDELERDVPEMDGLALIRRVRQSPNPRVQAVPALALTAYARSEDRVVALASGFQMHAAKPADPTELVVAVSSLAQRTVRGRDNEGLRLRA
jgi:CheY-like chemotaxis protein